MKSLLRTAATRWPLGLACALALSLSACFDVPSNAPPAKTSEVEDWRDEIIYQVLIDRFHNGDPNNDYNINLDSPAGWHGGDWQGVIDKLDYLDELGVTALWISPAVKNVEQDAGVGGYHGYWTQDFQATNPHFGDMAKLRELVDEAHKRGIKVILDIVTNHIGQLFYYDINMNGRPDINTQGSGYCYDTGSFGMNTSGVDCPAGEESRLVRVTEWDPDYDPRRVQSYTSLGEAGPAPIRWVYMPEDNRVPPMPEVFQNPEWYNRRGRVVTPWGWNFPEQVERADFPGGLKDINTTRPDVRAALIEVFTWWVEQTNIDGFRIDTVKHVEHEFWQEFAAALRANTKAMGKENFMMFGEIFDGNDELIGSYTKNGELDSTFYFSHKFQIFDDVFKRNQPTKKIEELYNLRAANYGTSGHPGGLTDAEGQPLAPTKALVNFMDNHDVGRFLWRYNDLEGLKAALFYLLTMDGIPCIYYGTEQGYNGGNDPANREDLWRMPPHEDFVLYAPDGSPIAASTQAEREAAFIPFNRAHPLYKHISGLSKLRKDLAPLRRGDFQIRWASERNGQEQDAGIIAFERSYNGSAVLVVLNAHPTKASETSATSLGGGNMKVGFPAGTRLVNVWDGTTGGTQEVTVDGSGEVLIQAPARGGLIFVAQ